MASHYDLNITQGNSYNVRLVAVDPNGTAYDLTNWSLRGFAKVKYSDATALIDLQPTKVSPYTNGFIDISLPATFTKNLPITEGVFDIEMYDASGHVDKLIKGYVRIYPEVTN
jgi:hypothetical protein